ncbi:MAG: Glycosyl transferase group 1 [Candidatus Gottesmanbacteria bacterium GW2011_GWA1_34_13]|uniref:Glycosyl transferase group 1 n=1 Tax=Candidatus Gottesmanbacteria bacterium GW2011_GWA1_34_13 TaxID=1618434 RepID=A0A0G0B8G4_9BACT|nr:MAG: Glycosyl transferase group 1 [Candidatus Gottesmanbacteria bacterium GW2011_GWA1_34_13]
MNICVLIDAWDPIWGGGQTHVWEISKLLIGKYNHNIDIYTRKIISEDNSTYVNNEQYYKGKLKIIRIGPLTKFFNPLARTLWFLSVMASVIKNHRQKKYTLIHAHAYLSGIPGKILSKLLGIPVVFTVHGSNLLDLNKKTLLYYLEKFILTQIKYDQEISVSNSFLKYENTNSNIEVIPNGVNVQEFDKVKKAVDKSKFSYLWVGRYDKVKGLPILIEAFNKLLLCYKDIQLILVGDGPEKNKIQLLVNKFKIIDFIKFIPKTKHEDLIKIYKQSDVFVLPSLTEGQPITILEAWAAKLPVIASKVGDNVKLIENEVNGILVNPNNIEDLYQAMLNIYRFNKRELLGNKGHELVLKKYTWIKNVIKLERIYKQLFLY